MKVCRFQRPGELELGEAPRPGVGPGDILLEVRATAICASDIRVFRGEKKARPGVIPGHETAGVVAELGDNVSGLAIGDPVTVYPIIACGACLFCLQGQRNRCRERLTLGYEVDGGLAEYVLIPEALVRLGHVMPLPDGLPPERATLTEPLACTLNSLESCRVGPGTSLVILGGGPMGLMHLILGQAMGAGPIIVTEPREERRALALELGAELCLDPVGEAILEAVLSATAGQGAEAVVVTLGHPGLIEQGLALAAKQGRVNLFAGSPPSSRVQLDPNRIHYDELTITGTQNASAEQFRRTLQLLGRLPQVERLISHRFPLEQALQAYEVRLAQEGLKPLVIPS